MVLELMVCCPLVVVEVPFSVTMFLRGGFGGGAVDWLSLVGDILSEAMSGRMV